MVPLSNDVTHNVFLTLLVNLPMLNCKYNSICVKNDLSLWWLLSKKSGIGTLISLVDTTILWLPSLALVVLGVGLES